MRSWCNPAGEDEEEPEFSLPLFEAAMEGYFGELKSWFGPTRHEVRSIVPGVERICVELATRFAADALHERYFGWNPQRFPSRGAHNLHRARGQLHLARSVRRQREQMQKILDSIPIRFA